MTQIINMTQIIKKLKRVAKKQGYSVKVDIYEMCPSNGRVGHFDKKVFVHSDNIWSATIILAHEIGHVFNDLKVSRGPLGRQCTLPKDICKEEERASAWAVQTLKRYQFPKIKEAEKEYRDKIIAYYRHYGLKGGSEWTP